MKIENAIKIKEERFGPNQRPYQKLAGPDRSSIQSKCVFSYNREKNYNLYFKQYSPTSRRQIAMHIPRSSYIDNLKFYEK